jgi:hypothetical protein
MMISSDSYGFLVVLCNSYVRKVSSGFEYFLLICALRLGLTLKGVGLDAELNSLPSGGIFKRRGRDEGVIEQKLGF